MNTKVKQAWLAALRSGKYRQGIGQLRIGDDFCCLGVICDLHAQAGLGEWHDGVYTTPGMLNSAALPRAVITWAGLRDSAPYINGYSLPEYNDGCGVRRHTFTEIADLIEAHL